MFTSSVLINGSESFILETNILNYKENETSRRTAFSQHWYEFSHSVRKTYSGKITGVSSYEFDSYWHESLVRYRVYNEYRATRGSRAELEFRSFTDFMNTTPRLPRCSLDSAQTVSQRTDSLARLGN